MKTRLGLDIGTNSIGWALIESDLDKKEGKIVGMGSRIIPMTADVISAFEGGKPIETAAAQRTHKRLMRRMYQRHQLRRERLLRVLNILGFLPSHFQEAIDFHQKRGQFKSGQQPLLVYRKTNEGDSREFLFKKSFNEMAAEFEKQGHTTKIPYDWTIYYLRKKGLKEALEKEELAWLLLHFNQKRGYYQTRDEVIEKDLSKHEEYIKATINTVRKTEDKSGAKHWYEMTLDNGLIYRRTGDDRLLEWQGSEREFIVTTKLDKNGKPQKTKDGEIKRSFRSPSADDWGLIKIRTEDALREYNTTNKTVGTGSFIYHSLLSDPTQKIIGGLIRTIERDFYKIELETILATQLKFHPELSNPSVIQRAIFELYPSNEVHRNTLLKKDIARIIIDDVLFYQRPLKSKKSEIADCQFEYRAFKDEHGVLIRKPLKAAPKSHPLFEEFRILQFLHNLRLYQEDFEDSRNQGGLVDVTEELIGSPETKELIYSWLSAQELVNQESFLKYLRSIKVIPKQNTAKYRWNFAEESKYPMAPARSGFLKRLLKIGVQEDWLTQERHYQLWHIVYSVRDVTMYKKALKTYAEKNGLPEDEFIEAFQSHKPFDSAYGAYSEKALKKLLPVMRFGKWWDQTAVPDEVKSRVLELQPEINEYLQGLDAPKFGEPDYSGPRTKKGSEQRRGMIKALSKLQSGSSLQGFNTYQACYAVYERHSENNEVAFWKTPEDIELYLKEFKAMALRNPIVEQIILETLRIVRDIWRQYGKGRTNFFDEINIELGRDLKNPAAVREKISNRIAENEATNLRIRALLTELGEDPGIEGSVRPYSPSHQEILKLYEEGALGGNDVPEDVEKISRSASPTRQELDRYKLWLDQRYTSPYTGQIIPLSKLFTTEYQIEHVIPKARYFDDSLANKVICESAVNDKKQQSTGLQYIIDNAGSVVDLGQGRSVRILNEDEYRALCKRVFGKHEKKLKLLLSADIPEDFVSRQLNDTRYISRFVMGLLSNIVREEGESTYRVNSLLAVNGAITSKMKMDWGLNDIWNRVIQPRFERLNSLKGSDEFGYYDERINAFRIQVPDSYRKGFSPKRIDHRHHALDALVIASVTPDHVNYLNSLNSNRKNHALTSKLLTIEKFEEVNTETGEISERKRKFFTKPWPNYTKDALTALEAIVTSFKVRHRVINRMSNKYWSFKDENGKPYRDKSGRSIKKLTPQVKGDAWAIRRQLHNDGVSGKVVIRRKTDTPVSIDKAVHEWQNIADKKVRDVIKKALSNRFKGDIKALAKHLKKYPLTIDGREISKVAIYTETEATAKRTPLTTDFTRKQLDKVTDTGIKRILENHLKRYTSPEGHENFEKAFSHEGLKAMNSDLRSLNGGKDHKPIRNVRVYEVSQRFQVGQTKDSAHKYVESAKGTNLFFAVYEDPETGARDFETVPLNEVIEHQKQVAHLPNQERTPIPINKAKGKLLFTLSPGDLVYNPTAEELESNTLPDFATLQKAVTDRIYVMEKATGKVCYFINHNIAALVAPYNAQQKFGEFKSQGKFESAYENEPAIKATCIKLKINSLGTIIGYEGWRKPS